MRKEDFEKMTHNERMSFIARKCSEASNRNFKAKHTAFRPVETVFNV